MKKRKLYYISIILLFASSLMINLLAYSANFSDWYTLHIYKRIVEVITSISNQIPFLLGEVLMLLIFVLVIASFLIAIACFILRKKKFYSFAKGYAKSMFLIVGIALFIYSTMWVLPFHTMKLTFGTDKEKQYTIKEILLVRNEMAKNINQLHEEMERDENGYPIVPDDVMSQVRSSIINLKKDFPSIGNVAAKEKYSAFSNVLDWMGIGGYTFPYTKEVCLNKYCNDFYTPVLYSHELAHHFGFFRENEGDFISFLSLSKSDCKYLNYAGYFYTWLHVDDIYRDNLDRIDSEDTVAYLNQNEILLNEAVYNDVAYFEQLAKKVYDEEVNKELEQAFSGVSEQVSKVGWDVQDAVLKEANYDGVMELLLRYYDGELY